ncbi:hypothetical protein ABZ579_30330, partial [Streptomyces thermolilacinus]
PGATALAHRLAGRLAGAAAKPSGVPGFAHGDAGTGWALLRFAAVAPTGPAGSAGPAPESYTSLGAALLRSALEDAPHRAGKDLGWYAGLTGTALAALDALPPADTARHADRWVRRLDGAAPAADLSDLTGSLGA